MLPDFTNVQAQWVTLTFIIGIAMIVIMYDITAAQAWGFDATISRVTRRLFNWCPILYPVFWIGIGILIGHIGLPCEMDR